MTSLIKHLHEFGREVHLTEDEWFQGIQFVTSVGQKCDDKRQEFILLSDTLGLSQLVVAQNHSRPQDVTEQTVFGPFHLNGAPHLPMGPTSLRAQRVSLSCFGHGQVGQGKPIAGATVDVWKAGAHGFYDVQHPEWQEMKLRAVFKTDAEGRFRLRTIKPVVPCADGCPGGPHAAALHQSPYVQPICIV